MTRKLDERAQGLPPAPGDPDPDHGFRDLRHYVPQDVVDPSFPAAMRGYDRAAVDAYVRRVNRVIAELKVSASPPAAVRHAVEQAEDKVQGLIGAARAAAEEMTASAQQEAEETRARAKAEAEALVVDAHAEANRTKGESDQLLAGAQRQAHEIVAAAEAAASETRANATAEAERTVAGARAEAEQLSARADEELGARRKEAESELGAIQAHTDAVKTQRNRLLEDLRTVAANLVRFADEASARFDRPERPGPEEETRRPEPDDAPDDVTRIVPPPAPASAVEQPLQQGASRPRPGGSA